MATNTSLKNQLMARSISAKKIVKSEAAAKIVNPKAARPVFKMGNKAYVQLALKTGLYKTLNVIEVYDGQLKYWDPVTEKLIIDTEAKAGRGVIGYAAYFELFNGFKKCVYVTRVSLENRKSRQQEGDTNYKKIVLREMLLKWGILSLDTQNTYVPELNEEVLLYKPLLKDEEVLSVTAEEKASFEA
jgi:recombination protein RecT